MTEDGLAIVAFHMLVEPDAGPALGQNAGKRSLADVEQVAAQIIAVQLVDRPVYRGRVERAETSPSLAAAK